MPTFNCPLVHTTHSNGGSASSPSTMQNLTRADPKLRRRLHKISSKISFSMLHLMSLHSSCFVADEASVCPLLMKSGIESFASRVDPGQRKKPNFRVWLSWAMRAVGARQSACNWPANFSWSSLQAVKLCSSSAKSVVLLMVNEQNHTSFVMGSWVIAKILFQHRGICEPRSKERGWCRATRPRLSPVTYPVHRL